MKPFSDASVLRMLHMYTITLVYHADIQATGIQPYKNVIHVFLPWFTTFHSEDAIAQMIDQTLLMESVKDANLQWPGMQTEEFVKTVQPVLIT